MDIFYKQIKTKQNKIAYLNSTVQMNNIDILNDYQSFTKDRFSSQLQKSQSQRELNDFRAQILISDLKISAMEHDAQTKLAQRAKTCKNLAKQKKGFSKNRKAQAVKRDTKQIISLKICKPKLMNDKSHYSSQTQYHSTQKFNNQDSSALSNGQFSFFSDISKEKINQEATQNSKGQSQKENLFESNQMKGIQSQERINKEKDQEEYQQNQNLIIKGKNPSPYNQESTCQRCQRISKKNQSGFYKIYKKGNGNPSKNNVEFQFKRILKNIQKVKGNKFVLNHPAIKQIKNSIKSRNKKNKNPTKQDLQKLILIQGINQKQAEMITDIRQIKNIVICADPTNQMLRDIFRTFILRRRTLRAWKTGKLDKIVDQQANEQMKLLTFEESTGQIINSQSIAESNTEQLNGQQVLEEIQQQKLPEKSEEIQPILFEKQSMEMEQEAPQQWLDQQMESQVKMPEELQQWQTWVTL